MRRKTAVRCAAAFQRKVRFRRGAEVPRGSPASPPNAYRIDAHAAPKRFGAARRAIREVADRLQGSSRSGHSEPILSRASAERLGRLPARVARAARRGFVCDRWRSKPKYRERIRSPKRYRPRALGPLTGEACDTLKELPLGAEPITSPCSFPAVVRHEHGHPGGTRPPDTRTPKRIETTGRRIAGAL